MSNDYDKGYTAGLQDGSCRFDCRKAKEAYRQGFYQGVAATNVDMVGRAIRENWHKKEND